MSPAVAELLPARKSLAGWAVLALGMAVFSYLLTLCLAAACVVLPYWLLSQDGVFAWQAVAAFVGGLVLAATMVWSLAPRRDRFLPPGPLLTAAGQPRLFAEIESIAKALGEAMPEAVYLAPDVNAGVAQRGGILGFGGRRVMILGLPLLEVLSVAEFRAVLAHEFGHYYGGDTRLGPWVYSARMAMARTLSGLGGNRQLTAVVGRIPIAGLIYHLSLMVLAAYWKLFLRATQLISRRQEYRADELACAVAGSGALMTGLRQIEGASAALPLFWTRSLVPLLQAGCRIPIADSFARFTALPNIATAISRHVQQRIETAKTGAFDSHPPLRDRLAAAASFAGPPRSGEGARAVTLFDGVDRLEVQLLETVAPQAHAGKLRLVSWDRIAPDVLLPAWRAFVAENAGLLAELRVEDVPRLAEDPSELVARMRDPKGMLLTRPQRVERARSVLWTAIIVALLDRGWELGGGPGESYLRLGECVLDADELGRQIRAAKLPAREWVARVAALGIGQIRLSAPAR